MGMLRKVNNWVIAGKELCKLLRAVHMKVSSLVFWVQVVEVLQAGLDHCGIAIDTVEKQIIDSEISHAWPCDANIQNTSYLIVLHIPK